MQHVSGRGLRSKNTSVSVLEPEVFGLGWSHIAMTLHHEEA